MRRSAKAVEESNYKNSSMILSYLRHTKNPAYVCELADNLGITTSAVESAIKYTRAKVADGHADFFGYMIAPTADGYRLITGPEDIDTIKNCYNAYMCVNESHERYLIGPMRKALEAAGNDICAIDAERRDSKPEFGNYSRTTGKEFYEKHGL